MSKSSQLFFETQTENERLRDFLALPVFTSQDIAEENAKSDPRFSSIFARILPLVVNMEPDFSPTSIATDLTVDAIMSGNEPSIDEIKSACKCAFDFDGDELPF